LKAIINGKMRLIEAGNKNKNNKKLCC